eukprot:TRINITY_DN1489_c0_g1_i8.p1 TRINITY_DN1489_c0_g1~~TRINITY_DN1489_c0_g1_i8.p1  ORF type:complete len:1690 (-),score=453.29 TRINITY_DN1489_c0_g1_i8:206-5275(-)
MCIRDRYQRRVRGKETTSHGADEPREQLIMNRDNPYYDVPEGRGRSGSNLSTDLSNAPITLPEWTEDRVNCASCDKGFTMVRRKHHCRLCGETFCGECSKNRRALPSYGIMDAARVCDTCTDKVDAADNKGLTSMAIEFSQGKITSLGSLDRMVASDAQATGAAVVAVGCVDALLKAALSAGNDARKLDSIMASTAKMCQQSEPVAAQVRSQGEWLGAAQTALTAAGQGGQHGTGSLAMLTILASLPGGLTKLSNEYSPWREILRALPPLMSSNGPGKEEALGLLNVVFPVGRNVAVAPASSFLSARGIAALFAVLQDRAVVASPGSTTCGLRLLVTLLDSCDRADVSANAGNFGAELDSPQGFKTVTRGLQSPVTQIRFLSAQVLLHMMLKSPNAIATHAPQYNGFAAIAAVLQRAAVSTEEAASATASAQPSRRGADNSFPFQSALAEMGFEEHKARKAVEATGGAGVEAAANWLFEHSDASEAFFRPTSADDSDEDEEEDDPAPVPEPTNTHLLVLTVLLRLLDQGLGFELAECGAADAAHSLIRALPSRTTNDSLEAKVVRKAFAVVNAMLTQVPGLADRLASTDSVGTAAQFMHTHPDIGGTQYVSSVASATDNPRVAEALVASPAVMQPLLDRVRSGDRSATMAMQALTNHSTVVEQLVVMGVVDALGRAVNGAPPEVASMAFEAAATLLRSGMHGTHAVLGSSLVGSALSSIEQPELRHPAAVLVEAAVKADPDVAEMAAAHDRLRAMLAQPHDSALLGALHGCLEASAGARTQLIEASHGQNILLPLLQLAVQGSDTVAEHAAGCAAALAQEPQLSVCLSEPSVAQWVLELLFQGCSAVQQCALTVLLAVWSGGYAQASGPETFAGLVQGVGMLLESEDDSVAQASLHLLQQACNSPEYCTAFGNAGVAPAVARLVSGDGQASAVQVLSLLLRNPACSDAATAALVGSSEAVQACVGLAVHGGDDAPGLGEARIVTVLLASSPNNAAWEAVLGTNFPNLLPLLQQAASAGSVLEQRVAQALGQGAAAPAPAEALQAAPQELAPAPSAPVPELPTYIPQPEYSQPAVPYSQQPAQISQPAVPYSPPVPAPAGPYTQPVHSPQPVVTPTALSSVPYNQPVPAPTLSSVPYAAQPPVSPTSPTPASTELFPSVPVHVPTTRDIYAPLPAVAAPAVQPAPSPKVESAAPTATSSLDEAGTLVRELSSPELHVSVAAAAKLLKLYTSTLSGALDSAAILAATLDQCVRCPRPSTAWSPMLKVLGAAAAATGSYAFPTGRLNDGIAVVVSALNGVGTEDEIAAALNLANALPEGGMDALEQTLSQQSNALAIRAMLNSEQLALQHCGLRALPKCSRPNWVQMSDVNRLMVLLTSTDHNTVLAVIAAVLFASTDARVGSIFLAKGAQQKLLELVLHHPHSTVQSAAAQALPVLLQSSPSSSLVQLLQTEWHQIIGLLPASQSAAAAILSLLAMFSSGDMLKAKTMVAQALPVLLDQTLAEQPMKDSLAKALATAVYDTELRALLQSKGGTATLASFLSPPSQGQEVSPGCTSSLEALMVLLSAPQTAEAAELAANQVIAPTVQLLASLAHVGCGGSVSRQAAAGAAQLLAQAVLVAPQAAVQQLMTHSAVPALVAMLQVPIPRDGSSCALRSCVAMALCPLALHAESRTAVRTALSSGSEVCAGACGS